MAVKRSSPVGFLVEDRLNGVGRRETAPWHLQGA